MEIIKDLLTGEEFIFVVNEDGTTYSTSKANYDEQQAKQNEGVINAN